jgi:hypothetical protein
MPPAARALLAAAATLLCGLAACERPTTPASKPVDLALIKVRTAQMHLRNDRVGHDQWESEATFVLVDAENTSTADALVTLGGALLDAAGKEIGPVRLESLRIPPGGRRTFALIDASQRVRANATSARVEVRGAFTPGYPPPVQIQDGHVFVDGDRVVVGGKIVNTMPRTAKAIVFAGFYDADDRPLTRPFTVFQLGADQSDSAQFVGPPGSKKAYLFIGDSVY